MNGVRLRLVLAAGALALLGAAPSQSPRTVRPGYWDISATATGNGARRVCLADPMMLAQWEHRPEQCTREVLHEQGSSVTIRYSCPRGGFGQSVLTLLTPRSMRVDTQGISGGGPFAYSLYARRAGNCPVR